MGSEGARIIPDNAAAPKLLAALKKAINLLPSDHGMPTPLFEECFEAIREAEEEIMSKHTSGPWTLERGKYSLSYQLRRNHRTLATISFASFIDYDLPTERKMTVEEAQANARVMASSVIGLSIAESTYLALLSIPHGSMWRIKNQSVYIALRDYISEATGETSEEVQNSFELLALGAEEEQWTNARRG